MFNKKILNFGDVGKARSFIYGVSILLIMFYHCGLRCSTTVGSFIKSTGDIGVEIFFFLSGISLYFSFTKDRNVPAFYARRMKRILPSYLIVYTAVFVFLDFVQSCNPRQFFLDITLLDFWLHGLGRAPWFVAAIIVFYALYPLLYDLTFVENKKRGLTVAFYTSIAIVMALLFIFCDQLRLFTVRIPIFITGCLFGKVVYDNEDLKAYFFLIITVLSAGSAVSFFLLKEFWWVKNVFYYFFGIFLVIVLTAAHKLISRFVPIVAIPFDFLGGITFEIYLCHEKIQEFLMLLLNHMGFQVEFQNFYYQITCIVSAIIIAFCVNKLGRLLLVPFRDKVAKTDKTK